MSFNSPSSPVYQTSAAQKRRAKEEVQRQRDGFKNIRDKMREKCRNRLMEARSASADARRNGLAELPGLIRLQLSEMEELEHNISLQDIIYKEMMMDVEDMYEMMIEQELEEANRIASGEEAYELSCPVCLHKLLSYDSENKLFKCECSTVFQFDGDLMALGKAIRAKVVEHGGYCLRLLRFFVEPKKNPDGSEAMRLSGFCYDCDYLLSL